MKRKKCRIVSVVIVFILTVGALLFCDEEKAAKETLSAVGKLEIARDSVVHASEYIEEYIAECMIEQPETSGQGESYETFRDFPYDRIVTVDDMAYKYISEAYAAVDFSAEFVPANVENKELYLEKYRDLMENEITFYDKETGEDLYLKEISRNYVFNNNSLENMDYSDLRLYFFDMDLDDAPELCIEDIGNFFYFFKYDPDTDEMYLWRDVSGNWTELLGSRKMAWYWSGVRFEFYQFDAEGEWSLVVPFYEDAFYGNGKLSYMVALPIDPREQEPDELPEELAEQGYYDESMSLYYFAVTEEQYNELTGRFFETMATQEENAAKEAYTYEELFGA